MHNQTQHLYKLSLLENFRLGEIRLHRIVTEMIERVEESIRITQNT